MIGLRKWVLNINSYHIYLSCKYLLYYWFINNKYSRLIFCLACLLVFLTYLILSYRDAEDFDSISRVCFCDYILDKCRYMDCNCGFASEDKEDNE